MRAALLAPLLTACLLPGCAFHMGWDSECDLEEPMSESFDLEGIREVHIVASAGELEIRGRDGAASLAFEGMARSSSLDAIQAIRLDYTRKEGVLELKAVLPDTYNACVALDIFLELPRDLPLTIVDGSGSMLLEGTSGAVITDGSGQITAHDIGGDLTIVDGSGSIELRDVSGEISIVDGSGSIDAERLGGGVTITDGSGSVELADVAGSVRIVADGSGSLDFRGIGGDVIVEADGSGSISVAGVDGDFHVLDGGSGSVNHSGVRGSVSISD